MNDLDWDAIPVAPPIAIPTTLPRSEPEPTFIKMESWDAVWFGFLIGFGLFLFSLCLLPFAVIWLMVMGN